MKLFNPILELILCFLLIVIIISDDILIRFVFGLLLFIYTFELIYFINKDTIPIWRYIFKKKLLKND
jgi:hypothetical protein